MVPVDSGGTYSRGNARTLCGDCADGLDGVPFAERPNARFLLVQTRRATGADQLEVLKWLISKYPVQAAKITAKMEK